MSVCGSGSVPSVTAMRKRGAGKKNSVAPPKGDASTESARMGAQTTVAAPEESAARYVANCLVHGLPSKPSAKMTSLASVVENNSETVSGRKVASPA